MNRRTHADKPSDTRLIHRGLQQSNNERGVALYKRDAPSKLKASEPQK